MIDIRRHGAKKGKDISIAILSALEEAQEIQVKLQKQDKWLSIKSPIFIPSGHWYWENSVEWATGVSLYGEDQASTLIDFQIPKNHFAIDTYSIIEPYAFKIKNFHARSLTPFSGGFIRAKMANRSSIFSELFIEGFDVAFDLEDCFTSVVRDCTVYQCTVGVVGRNLTNTKFYNNKIENCSNHGMYLAGSNTNTITGTSLFGNIFQGNGRAGLYLEGLDQASFIGNFFEGNNRISFRRDGSKDNEAHIEIRGKNGDHSFNRRNGNLHFQSTFFTQGFYSPNDTVCAAIHVGEIVRFDGGTARAFSKIGKGFYIGNKVTLPSVENFTFEGIQPNNCFTGPGVKDLRRRGNLFGIKNLSSLDQPYHFFSP